MEVVSSLQKIIPFTKMNNETICIVESESSDVEILNVGRWGGFGIALVVGLISFVGFIVRGLFLYYLKYEAPKDRPINSLMFYDQVRYQVPQYVNIKICKV